MVGQYVRKSTGAVVTAIQFREALPTLQFIDHAGSLIEPDEGAAYILLAGQLAGVRLYQGDWLVRDGDGRFSTRSPAAFASQFEPVAA